MIDLALNIASFLFLAFVGYIGLLLLLMAIIAAKDLIICLAVPGAVIAGLYYAPGWASATLVLLVLAACLYDWWRKRRPTPPAA